jgi:hypothetical protein
MKQFTFPATCEFGPGDFGETWVCVDLTDDEAERLEKYGRNPEVFERGFGRCAEIRDIYCKVYKVANLQITEEAIDGDMAPAEYYEALEDEEIDFDITAWRADQTYGVSVGFPEEFNKQ